MTPSGRKAFEEYKEPPKAKQQVYVFDYRSNHKSFPEHSASFSRSWTRDSVSARSGKEALGRLTRRLARGGHVLVEHKITAVH